MKILNKIPEYRYVRMLMRRYSKHMPRHGLLAVAAAKLALVGFLAFHAAPAFAAEKDSVYDRVMSSGTIRCGYGVADLPFLKKDVKTGAFSGIYYDYMEELGKALHLKIKWTEETGWGDYIAALDSGRFDAYCTVVGLNAERARQADFLTPLLSLKTGIYVKDGDMRFDKNLARANAPDVTLATVEGDLYDKIAARDFPLAKKLELPQLATQAELFSTLATGKADLVINAASWGSEYMHANPGKIDEVKLDAPYHPLPASISIKGGEYRFQRMLDIATVEMLNNGTIKNILDKYDPNRLSVADVTETVKAK